MHSNHFSVVKPAVCRHCAGIVPAPHKKEKKEENNCAGAAPAPAGDVRIFVRRSSDFFLRIFVRISRQIPEPYINHQHLTFSSVGKPAAEPETQN